MDEIGQKLRTARIEKGYTLDDLQQITKIQKRYLIAIEEGNFDALPGDFYVRAFIKQYAETVGLNSDELLTQFQQDIPDTQPQEYVEQSVENRTRSARTASTNPVNKLRQHAVPIFLVAAVVVIVLVVYFVMFKFSQQPKQTVPTDNARVSVSSSKASSKKAAQSSSSKQSSKAASSSKTSAKKTKKAKKAKQSSKKKTQKVTVENVSSSQQTATVTGLPKTGNKLTVAAKDSAAWIAVYVNGSIVWQGTLQAGSDHTVDITDGATSFAVHSGNTPGTTIKLNGKKVDISGESGFVRTITFKSADATTESGD